MIHAMDENFNRPATMASNGRDCGKFSENDDEDPKDSVAANCIRFTHDCGLTKNTHCQQPQCENPVYTHQCFPGEYIPGYHPLTTSSINNSNSSNIQKYHSSYQHAATHRLAIDIVLAPACDRCTVSLQVRPLIQKRAAALEPPPRDESDDDDDDTEEGNDVNPADRNATTKTTQPTDNNNNDDDDDSIELGSEDTDDRSDEDDETTTAVTLSSRRLSEKEICAQLQHFLPPIVVSKSACDTEHEIFACLSNPVGTVVTEYSLTSTTTTTMNFCLTVSSGTDCAVYHQAVQKLASWYIEAASDIDPMEEGAWKILYLFRRHDDDTQKYSLVGYMTLYHFASPFRKPVGGTIVRVCQALILPWYHRMGHGKRMLHAVFDLCAASNNNIVEVNVEDPAPEFAALRDVVDWERYSQSGQSWFREQCHDIAETDFFAMLKDSDALRITVLSRTTTRQIQVVYELDRLQRLQQHLLETEIQKSSSGHDNDKEKNQKDQQRELLNKRFRLMVKQRLNRQNREEIVARCGSDKVAAKQLLDDMFQASHQHYMAILRRPVKK